MTKLEKGNEFVKNGSILKDTGFWFSCAQYNFRLFFFKRKIHEECQPRMIRSKVMELKRT